MVNVSGITGTLLLLPMVVLADYYIDNADTSIAYSMPATGRSWQTYSMSNPVEIIFSNSTGNYTIVLNSTDCYGQNYTSSASAQGGCRTDDGCFVHIPFTGSGITMYVFNAGLSGMTASFSVDGGAAVSSSIAGPTAAENYQVSNVSLYDVQGLQTGNHTIKMTLMDWNGGVTYMKFDYAHVNETFVAVPSSATASLAPTATSTPPTASAVQSSTARVTSAPSQNRIGAGDIAGITSGCVAMIGGIVIGILWIRKCKASHQRGSSTASESALQIEPFTMTSESEHLSSSTSFFRPHTQYSSSLSLRSDVIPPLMRSAILRDAHAFSNSFSSAPVAEEGPSPFLDSAIVSQNNLTPAQIEAVRGLLACNLGRSATTDAILLVIEAFLAGETNSRQVIPSSEYARSLESPPSYQTRDRRGN